jgi:hypothetical protein
MLEDSFLGHSKVTFVMSMALCSTMKCSGRENRRGGPTLRTFIPAFFFSELFTSVNEESCTTAWRRWAQESCSLEEALGELQADSARRREELVCTEFLPGAPLSPRLLLITAETLEGKPG